MAGLLAAALVAAHAPWGASGGRAAAASMYMTPSSANVDLGSGSVEFDIYVRDAANVGAFGFVLRYDEGVLADPQFTPGDFLDQTGRQVNCPDPVIDAPHNGDGSAEYGCASFGSEPGASGEGLLASVRFTLAGGSASDVRLDQATLADPLANFLCTGARGTCPVANAHVDVLGGDPAENEGVGAAPTQAAAQPTPTPRTGQTAAQTAVAAGENAPAAPNGTAGASAAGARPASVGSTQVQTAGSGRGAADVGRLGTGAAAESGDSRLGAWTLVAAALGALGACAIAAGRRRYRRATRR